MKSTDAAIATRGDASPTAQLEAALLASYRAVGIDAIQVAVNVHIGVAALTYRDPSGEEHVLTTAVPRELLQPLAS